MEYSLLIREGKRHTKLNTIQIADVHSTSIVICQKKFFTLYFERIIGQIQPCQFKFSVNVC